MIQGVFVTLERVISIICDPLEEIRQDLFDLTILSVDYERSDGIHGWVTGKLRLKWDRMQE